MSTEPTSRNSRHALAHGHEERDVWFRPIVIASVILVVTIIVAAVGMRLLFVHYLDREARLSPAANPLAAAAGERLPPEPRLQPKPVEQLRLLRKEENETLQTYGWVDRANGVVRIPIERAMDLVAKRGLPAAKSAQRPDEPQTGAEAP